MDIQSKNTFGIQFVLRLPKKKKDETATVYAWIIENGRRTEISLKSKVSINNWDEVKARVKGKRPEIIELKSHMEHVRSLNFDSYQGVYPKFCVFEK